jgi:hypothetical protein
MGTEKPVTILKTKLRRETPIVADPGELDPGPVSVTDRESCVIRALPSRNDVTDKQLPAGGKLLNGNGFIARRNRQRLEREAENKGGICGGCFRKLEPTETVWRFNSGPPAYAACCHGEARDWRYWCPESPCQGCGRGVIYQVNLRRRIHVFCCDHCESVYRWRLKKTQREIPSCETCNQPFSSKRADAKHCSPACKQKAYRQRKVQTRPEIVGDE